MKIRLWLPIAVCLACVPSVTQAQQSIAQAGKEASARSKASKKPTSMPGKVGGEGKTFTADKGNRIWMVSNPEALSGIDGHHVRVRAQVDTNRNQMRVISVSAITEQRAGIKLDDAAFRR